MTPVTIARKSGPSLLMLYSMMFAVPWTDESAASAVVVEATGALARGAAVAQPATATAPPSATVPNSAAILAFFMG